MIRDISLVVGGVVITFICDWALSGLDSSPVKEIVVSSLFWSTLTYACLIAVNHTLERKRSGFIISSWLFFLVVVVLATAISMKFKIDVVGSLSFLGGAAGLSLGFIVFKAANRKRLQMDLVMSVALVIAITLIGGIYWNAEARTPQLLIVCVSLALSVFSVMFTGTETRRKNRRSRLDHYERRFYDTLLAVR